MKSKEITVSNQEIHINKDDYYFTLSRKMDRRRKCYEHHSKGMQI